MSTDELWEVSRLIERVKLQRHSHTQATKKHTEEMKNKNES